MSESPFDYIDVDGPYTVFKFVEGKLQPEECNGVHQVHRDVAYVNAAAKRFFEKYPERGNSVCNLDELKAFDEQEKHPVQG